MSSASDQYTVLTETEERLFIFDTYVLATIGLTLTVLILSSLININRNSNNKNKYYRYGTICGIVSCIAAIIFYLVRILFTSDLIFPLNYENNVDIVTSLDSIIMTSWSIEKIAFYYGFVFVYSSLFTKDSVELSLKIIMVVYAVVFIAYNSFYFIADVMTSDLDEISVGAKRGTYAVLPVSADVPNSVAVTASLAFISESLVVLALIYKFYSNGTKKGDKNGTKGIVLLCIVFVSWMIFIIVQMSGSDIKFIIGSIGVMVDTVCLYLIFNENQEIYNNLCGCICGGSKYKPVEAIDDDDGGNEQEDDQQQLV